MNAKSDTPPAPEDLATEQLLAEVESAIVKIQEHLANPNTDGKDAKSLLESGAKLLHLRNQLQEQLPRTISVRWVDDQPKPNPRVEIYIDAYRNKGAKK